MAIGGQQMILSERFQVAFNQIHEALMRIVRINDDRLKVLLNVGAAKNYQVIKTYYNDLEQYAKLRNALVHDKRNLNYYIAEPHIQVVEHIEKIAKILTSPNSALSIATKEVIFYQYDDQITNVIKGIKKHPYSRYPIYHKEKFKGILRTSDIVKWMSEHLDNSILDVCNITVSDVMNLKSVTQHPVEFTAKSANIFEVEELFEKAHKQNRKLEAVIITENGKPNEKPLGLVTAWDLIEIDYSSE